MLLYQLGLMLVALGGNIFLSLFTFLKNPKSTTNRLFFTFTISLSVYLVINFLATHQTISQMTLIWVRTIMSVAVIINLLFYLLVATFPQQKLQVNRNILWVVITFTLLMLPITQTNLIFKEIIVKANNTESVPGVGMPLFLLHTLILIGGGFLTLVRKFLKARGVEKTQIRLLLLGTILMFVSILVTNLFFVLIFNTSAFIDFLPFYILIFVSFISYAIIRHRFLDIRLVVARTVSFALLTGLFGLLYALFFGAGSSILTSSAIEIRTIAVSTTLALIMAFSFQPIRRALEAVSDKLFYKSGYDSSELLSRLGVIMSTNIELQPLATQIIQTLIVQMKVSKGAFVILGEGLASIYDIIDIGFPQRLTLFHDQISPFFPFQQTFVFDELEENHLKDLMRQMNISVVKTLNVKGSIVGILLLGEKASGEIYSQQDLKVLEILSPEVAVAIQNSQSYDKIKKFNVILSQEVKRATVDLQEANNRLKIVDKLKDDFVSIASHELRTPMTAIRSYAWMTLHRPDTPLSKTMEKYITRILMSTERLINLVNDMLNVSRIESGRIEINPEPVDLISLVRDIIDELYFSKSEEKHIDFVVLEKPIPKVLGDPEKLRQVFLNLVGNSLKFTPSGGKIIFDFFTDGRVVEISVSDTGVGISKEDLSKLFHKFSRLDNSYTAAATSGGTGLGLYISKSLIELMHGRIWATSAGAGKGTTMVISLPVVTQDVLKNIDRYKIKPKGEVKGLEPVAI